MLLHCSDANTPPRKSVWILILLVAGDIIVILEDTGFIVARAIALHMIQGHLLLLMLIVINAAWWADQMHAALGGPYPRDSDYSTRARACDQIRDSFSLLVALRYLLEELATRWIITLCLVSLWQLLFVFLTWTSRRSIRACTSTDALSLMQGGWDFILLLYHELLV